MDDIVKAKLLSKIEQGGHAYIRNLVAAEKAVQRGQFNLAKLLRAAAHSQRVMAMEVARIVDDDHDGMDSLAQILQETGQEREIDSSKIDEISTVRKLEQIAAVRARLHELVQRSAESLKRNSDILESDVAQFLFGCYGCGAVMEGSRPHSCPVCGALGVEIEGFGPFYSSTAEHLGQLTPKEIIETLESIQGELAEAMGEIETNVLHHKPSTDEWSAAEIVGHMLETDLLFIQRAQALLQEQGIELPWPMPPWKLHEGKGYESMTAAELLYSFRQTRERSLSLIKELTPKDWMRTGLSFGSKISMLDLCSWLANHDLGHLAQVKRLCRNLG